MAARSWYLAWLASETEAFDPVAHRRRDIPLKSVTVREEEAVDAHSCAIVTALMPTAQLAGRRWALLSFELPNGTLVPVCRMRRRPVPSRDTEGELNLEFDALPTDWLTRRDAGLLPLKVRPYFEPLFVAPNRQNDPVEILDGHRRCMHFDRVTGAFSTPEMLGVGLPVKVLRARDLVGAKNGGGIKIRRTQQPLAGVQVNISMAWQQALDGAFDASPQLRAAFPNGAVGDPTDTGPSAGKTVPGGVIATLTPEPLASSMPKPGASLGGASGYEVLEATLTPVPVPGGAAARTGACRGQKARYSYVNDANLRTPINLGFEISYFDGTFWLGYSLRQRREERLSFFVRNANVAYADGAVETIDLRGQDPTIDSETLPWLPGLNVATGDLRRVGIYVWSCLRPHVTAATFSADLNTAAGVPQWQLLGTTGAPAGTSNLASWFNTDAGVAMCAAAGHKAHKKLSLSQRSIEVRFVVPFEDWPDVSTAWAARLEVDDPRIPGGVAVGKVTSVEISQGGPRDFAKAAVTILCCDGSGAASPGPNEGINPTGEPWDGFSLSSPKGTPVPPTPVPGVTIRAEFHPQDQVSFIQANDFTGEPGRNDRSANDPKSLLGKAKTKLVFEGNQISGQPTLSVDIALAAGAWPGPRQIVNAEI